MSGWKASQFRLQREREEKQRQVQRLAGLHGELTGLRTRVATALRRVSEGLRATFSTEVQSAEGWLGGLDLPNIDDLGMDSAPGALADAEARLRQAVETGRRLHRTLTVAFAQRADEMGKRLAQDLAEVEGTYVSREELLRLWFGEAQTRAWQDVLKRAQGMLAHEEYAALEKVLRDLRAEIQHNARIAEAQEDKHQKRLYLLKALRQACAEMGFREMSGPGYEREGERGSRILLTVDTMDRGQIAFTLSLDTVSSFSEIAENRCFEEFDEISRYLEQQFGIHTKFRPEAGAPEPRLIRKGEMDLPGDAGMVAER